MSDAELRSARLEAPAPAAPPERRPALPEPPARAHPGLLRQLPEGLLESLPDQGLRRWLEEETEGLQRLANTQRLKGDYVAAQLLELEVRELAAEISEALRDQPVSQQITGRRGRDGS